MICRKSVLFTAAITILATLSTRQSSCHANPFLPSTSNIRSTINTFYKENPFKGAFLTCSIKGCSADLVAQYISSKREYRREQELLQQQLEEDDEGYINPFHTLLSSLRKARGGELSEREQQERKHKLNIDWKRSLVFILYGGFYQGCAQEFIYNSVLPILGTGTDMKTVARKVAVDMGLLSPLLCIPTAYVIKGSLIGNSFKQSLANYVDDVLHQGVVFKNWMIFVPVQCITFSIIPEHFRVSFVACISFFWMILLSSILSG